MQANDNQTTPEIVQLSPDGVVSPILPSNPEPTAKRMLRLPIMVAGVVVLLLITAAGFWWLGRNSNEPADTTNTKQSTQAQNSTLTEGATGSVEGLELNESKEYGNKYADGILPVGDNKYSTSSAQKGSIYMCNANFVPANQAGASSRGPWFVGTTEWDINKKYAVQGSVEWEESITNTISGEHRIITTNGLPDHVTGVFPVTSSDPAYAYDRNPNSIASQSLIYNLAAHPTYSSTPQCMGGEVGVMLTGTALFNGFDAGARDAGAWEIQDGCEGHPQATGIYHYHTLSSCIKDVNVSTVIGFALDGYPITGPKVGENNYLTTSDLDECHGIVSEVMLDGLKTKTYHYVMTQDFPYSVSCFRSTPIQSPGQHAGGGQPPAGGPGGHRP